jgi:hypothetical protein
MQGLTIAMLMNEQLSQLRAESYEARREAAALELRRHVTEARARRAETEPSAPEASTESESLGFVPTLSGYPYESR